MPIATASRPTRPSRTAHAAAPDFALHIATAWLVLGCIGVLAIPALRGTSTWFGWLPFWLVLMPAAECLLLRWRPLLAASRTTLSRMRESRQHRHLSRRTKKQHSARRTHSRPQIKHLLTALLSR